MKIAFITSSAEPGKDGMGDYTRSLAAALCGVGHEVLVVGLNDRWLADQSAVVSGKNADGVLLERCPQSLPYAERIGRVAARLRDFGADWASFQMSCYAYHPKGLFFGLNRHLPKLASAVENWQVMFQELWIAFETDSTLKQRLVGILQRLAIKGGVRALRPKIFHTSTPLFRAMLKTIGIGASILPLAGSIPVNPDPGTEWFHGLLGLVGAKGAPIAADQRSGHLVVGFFGAIYPNWEPEPFFSSLRNVAQKTGQKVTILAAGRMGGGGEEIWERLVPAYPDFGFQKLGELSFGRVSQYLRNLDIGIAATPWLAIGKSSATAAMLDHGIPVMVTRNDCQPRQRLQIDPPSNPLLILAEHDVTDRILAGFPRHEPRHTARDLAEEFVRRMEKVKSAPKAGG
ncbi:MAG: hypothetical protein NTV08_10690 [Verrucomicrobia bacterium]|nr:hypothetical protein [Verrucomicrobiota bacterium]